MRRRGRERDSKSETVEKKTLVLFSAMYQEAKVKCYTKLFKKAPLHQALKVLFFFFFYLFSSSVHFFVAVFSLVSLKGLLFLLLSRPEKEKEGGESRTSISATCCSFSSSSFPPFSFLQNCTNHQKGSLAMSSLQQRFLIS